jgi:hypothetical protein
MEHGQLAGEAEDEIEGDGENAVDEREDEDGQQEIALDEDRQRVERPPEQEMAGDAYSSPNRPTGLNSRIATSTASP